MTPIRSDLANDGPLSGLQAVDWGRRLDCRGETDAVPRLLRTLWTPEADDDPGRAPRELAARLVPWEGGQATFCMRAATPAAVPFLVRLAHDGRTPDRWACVDLLSRVADALERGPEGSCFGEWPDRWFDASARALVTTEVTGWFPTVDEAPDWGRRRATLRLLAVAGRLSCAGGLPSLPGLLWSWTQDAGDVRPLRERLICLAHATADHPGEQPPTDVPDDASTDVLADVLADVSAAAPEGWLIAAERPSNAVTTAAARAALHQLAAAAPRFPWMDLDTVHALAELAETADAANRT